MSEYDNDFIDDGEFEMINPESLSNSGPILPGGISAQSLQMPPAPTGRSPKIPQPIIDEDNVEDIEDGLRSFLGGSSSYKQQPQIRHPRHTEYERKVVEESYDEEYDDLRSGMNAISNRSRDIPRQSSGFNSAAEMMRQFKKFMMSDIIDSPNFDVEELKYTLEDMMDMVELFVKQRARRSKVNRVTRRNPIVQRGLKQDVYDVIDDEELYMPDL